MNINEIISKLKMGSLFSSNKGNRKGGPPNAQVTEQDKAILSAKMTRDRLRQICRRCDTSIENDKDRARILLKEGNKSQALLLLKRKRYEESTRGQVEVYIDKIEQMIRSLEMAQLNVEVAERLKQGNEAMKKINESISIEEVERILDESREAEAFQEELAFLLRGKLSEEDLEAAEQEYEQLLAEQLPEAVTDKLEPEQKEAEKKKEKERKRNKEAVALEAS